MNKEYKNVFEELKNLAEPAFKEFKTTEFIANYLEKNGIKHITKKGSVKSIIKELYSKPYGTLSKAANPSSGT